VSLVQELGSLPAAELELYKSYGIKQLYKQLHDCNEKLKKYSHVNKKALDQYINFSDQRTELLQRKKELDDGSQAIENLIGNLDRQKDEAIIRTFRGA
jgi:structural maintenance of chromosome 3 (chondroitin sulfate proteoglycan 6)